MPGNDWQQTLDSTISKLDMDTLPASGVINKNSYANAFLDIRNRLDQDAEILAKTGATLYGSHTESRPGENGDKIAQTFTRWRDDQAPSIPALLLDAADKQGIEKDTPAFQAALMTGIAAEVSLQNDYHDNNHFREVVAASIRLCVTNNELAAAGEPGCELLDSTDLAKVFLAASGHDLNHNGENNSPGGQHTQYLLEQQSIDAMAPFMAAAGMDAKDIDDVKTMIRVTDVSAPNGGTSPHNHLKATAKAMREHGHIDPAKLPSELQAIGKDPKLLQMAAIISDSDLTPSAGTNYAFNQRMTVNMHGEAPAIKPGPATTEFFCNVIVGGEFTSNAGRTHLQTSLSGMINTATDLRQKMEAQLKQGQDNKKNGPQAPAKKAAHGT